MIDEVIKKLKN